MRILGIVLVLLLALCGCRTMAPVQQYAPGSSLVGKVEAGDTVQVLTSDGQLRTFVVTQVTTDELVGADVRVARADIKSLQVSTVHRGRTIGAGIGGGLTILYVLLAAAFASLLGGG